MNELQVQGVYTVSVYEDLLNNRLAMPILFQGICLDIKPKEGYAYFVDLDNYELKIIDGRATFQALTPFKRMTTRILLKDIPEATSILPAPIKKRPSDSSKTPSDSSNPPSTKKPFLSFSGLLGVKPKTPALNPSATELDAYLKVNFQQIVVDTEARIKAQMPIPGKVAPLDNTERDRINQLLAAFQAAVIAKGYTPASYGDAPQYGTGGIPDPAKTATIPGQIHAANVHRVYVLLETLAQLSTPAARDNKRKLATDNLARWQTAVKSKVTGGGVGGARLAGSPPLVMRVAQGDFLTIAGAATQEFGVIFAVLNMANAIRFGGGYYNGPGAQEENLFRRSDMHFAELAATLNQGHYSPKMTTLINGTNHRVLLRKDPVRFCFIDSEDKGYIPLAENQIFPFLDFRSAAIDCSVDRQTKLPKNVFSVRDCMNRIHAQFLTLIEQGVRHVVLSAFGCGAFDNPPESVAHCYRQAILLFRDHFDVIIFAIYDPPWVERKNFPVFDTILADVKA